ncbi:NADH dehydrogenase subunit M [cyanobacterium endosymbiont of Rhopalodia gibberula]|uniref:NAD(P)H-quinone oxidoreductase subunit O n=1 Tax=cyanobacterium endosymbiont of Rhopalodia gibberula TaxID=1763363 RepID=UPI000DC7058D|nr:NAD(P)H-quinone oxidoreductase subunit O [cyanobacterium endosymbiont of Rhopalodia gibberula]BBA78973.1 NADH dehydrogenase subunit M [cyanobacterium endosymbiont of Rhopalodia gibberula]
MSAKIKKGSLVRTVRERLENSLEAQSSDSRHFPRYIFESKGEILELNDEYALVKFYIPTPNVWFRLDQLEIID